MCINYCCNFSSDCKKQVCCLRIKIIMMAPKYILHNIPTSSTALNIWEWEMGSVKVQKGFFLHKINVDIALGQPQTILRTTDYSLGSPALQYTHACTTQDRMLRVLYTSIHNPQICLKQCYISPQADRSVHPDTNLTPGWLYSTTQPLPLFIPRYLFTTYHFYNQTLIHTPALWTGEMKEMTHFWVPDPPRSRPGSAGAQGLAVLLHHDQFSLT